MTLTILTFDQLPERTQRHILKNRSARVQQTYKDLNLEPDIPKCDESARDWADQKLYSAVNGRYCIVSIDKIQ